MPGEVLFEAEATYSREEIAWVLEEVIANNLERGGRITIGAGSDARVAGNEFVTLDPPSSLTSGIGVERERPTDSPGTKRLTIELAWDQNGDSSDSRDD